MFLFAVSCDSPVSFPTSFAFAHSMHLGLCGLEESGQLADLCRFLLVVCLVA